MAKLHELNGLSNMN